VHLTNKLGRTEVVCFAGTSSLGRRTKSGPCEQQRIVWGCRCFVYDYSTSLYHWYSACLFYL